MSDDQQNLPHDTKYHKKKTYKNITLLLLILTYKKKAKNYLIDDGCTVEEN